MLLRFKIDKTLLQILLWELKMSCDKERNKKTKIKKIQLLCQEMFM